MGALFSIRRAHLVAQALARQFHDREVEKRYIALVWGEVHAGRRIDAPIGRDPADRKKMSARARRARSAVTRIARAEALRVQNEALAKNKDVLELRRIEVERLKAEKWNGQLPTAIYAGAPIPFLNVSK